MKSRTTRAILFLRPDQHVAVAFEDAPNREPPPRKKDLEILQQEQDHAVSLSSSSLLIPSLFVSYANRAAVPKSASNTLSPDNEEWKALHTTVAAS